MSDRHVGLYIHVPFCLSKCLYCDFYSRAGRERDMDAYVKAAQAEMRSYAQNSEPLVADTVFFGGGTPTFLGVDRIVRLLTTVRECFTVPENVSVTIEMNPATVGPDDLRLLRREGVTRVSLGVQSLSDQELTGLGRAHSAHDALRAIEWIGTAGFSEVSYDVMYGIPHQTRDSLYQTLEQLYSFSPTHLSAYGLIIEDGTPFFDHRDRLPLPGEEEERAMYDLCCDTARSHGFSHYEISNYALPGHESLHNLKYWRMEPYIGIGPAAHSYFDGMRHMNSSDLDAYLSDPLGCRETKEVVGGTDYAYEYAMLGLRLREGISLSRYRDLAGHSFAMGKEKTLDRAEDAGYLRRSGDRLSLTESGFYVSLALLGEFL